MGLPTLGASVCIGKPVKVYVLIDGQNGRGFYVGATTRRLCERLSNHKTHAVRLNTACEKSQIIRDIVAAGSKVEILELETVSADVWAEAEQFWISYLRFIGARLTNKSIGGAGNQGVRASAATRRAISEAAAGRDMSHVHCAEIRQRVADKLRGRRGKKASSETRLRLSVAHRGKKWPPGQREKFAAKMTGRKRGPTGVPSPRRRPILIDGREYESLTQAAHRLGVAISTISKWLRSGLASYADGSTATPMEKPILGRGPARGARNGKSRAVIISGVEYPTLGAASAALGRAVSTLRAWIKNGRAQTR